MSAIASILPGHACHVFLAEDVFVAAGVNLDDGLAPPDAVNLGDIYQLGAQAAPRRLVLANGPSDQDQTIAAGSHVGAPGDVVRLVARYTMMSFDAVRIEVLLLSHATGLFALPLSPMERRTEYTLVEIDTAPVATRLSDLLCVAFARGTLITLPTGLQTPIERLHPGDRVLTRDHGAQPLRWIGRVTLRAIGPFAPVVVSQGTLGNSRDLIVSPHHRLFLYHRARQPELPTAEVLVQAKHLVDDGPIFVREGGVVDYFSLVFDRHEIIYAEGIPAESLMVTEATVARLPDELAEPLLARFPGLRHDPHFGTEAGRGTLDAVGRETLLQPRRSIGG
jgi:hypothetical protein